MTKFAKYIESLRETPGENLFNPWWERDEDNDDYTNSPEIRRHQLKTYLEERETSTRFLLVAEALGYQGGHFTGIAMTSERIITGKMLHKGIKPEHVFTKIEPTRTSSETAKKDGFSEPTATIVWGHLLELGLDPYSFTLWNALPWHPYNPAKGLLSNRTPSNKEMEAGLKKLEDLISILKPEKIVAVGEKSSVQLQTLGLEFSKVRHPANGGAGKFRDQFSELMK